MKAEAINEKLAAEKAELEESLARGDEVVQEMLGKVKHLEAEKNQLDKQVFKIIIHQTVITTFSIFPFCNFSVIITLSIFAYRIPKSAVN